MGRVISFVSGKGGVGKSVLCAGIGCAIGEMGRSVCLLDFDFGLNNLDLMLNIEEKVVYDITDFLAGRTRLRQTLVSDEKRENGLKKTDNVPYYMLRIITEHLPPR